ncbi:MAG: hypothetical protein AABW73_04345 [Nanoarchaeota archaeon]
MGLFSKKGDKNSEFDKLPELPQLPKSISSYGQTNNGQIGDQSGMSSSTNKWNIAAVKEAVRGSDESNNYAQDYSDLGEGSSGDREVIMGIGAPRTRPMNNFQQAPAAMSARREPLFVRIDKFESSIRDFEDISIKIKRVEELITDIKELREREDREFSEWEKDLQIVKSRLDSIDRTLFSQLD